jgi:phage terminase large subunit-like protein
MTTGSKDPTTQHAEDVVSGKFVAGPYVRDTCKRHLRDLETAKDRGLVWDPKAAQHTMDFFPKVLRLNGGQFEGMPFELHNVQQFLVGSLFGWKREDGTRRFRVSYIEMGKGNGKSPLAGGIGLFGMVADQEPRAEIYAAATKKDQAMILFRDAVAMVNQSPRLADAIKKSGKDDKVWNLYHPKTNSFFRPISADDGQSGPRPHLGLIDELHEHRNGAVINLMSAGRKWRRQPLILAITNSGTDKTSVCWEYHEAAVDVASGAKLDDTFFSYVCALDDGEDPFQDEASWIKANPLLNKIIMPSYLRDEVNQARGMPSKESLVRRLNFCQWTESTSPLFPMDRWDACGLDYDIEIFRGRDVVAAADLSSSQDLTCIMLATTINNRIYWLPLFWVPEEGIAAKSKKDKVPYDIWLRNKVILGTPGRSVQKDFVIRELARLQQAYQFRIQKLMYDRWRIDELKQAAERQGVTIQFEEFGQGFKDMAPAVDVVETDMTSGKLAHNRNPCLRWNIANAIAVQDPAGNRKLDKSKVTGRIDGAVAGLMAHHKATLQTPTVEPRFRWLA